MIIINYQLIIFNNDNDWIVKIRVKNLLGTFFTLAYKVLGGLKMKDFKFVELVLFGSWVRKRHPEMIEALEDLYEEFYDEFGRFERNEREDSLREGSN